MLEILDILFIISILFGIFVITTKNPIISVLFLIGLFLTIAIYLILLGIHFIGLSYLLIYVGAISILFIFILMLINVRVSELLNRTKNSIPLAGIVSVVFSYCMYKLLPINFINYKLFNGIFFWKTEKDYINIYSNEYIVKNVTTNNWESKLIDMDHISSIGNLLYTNYSLWLILTSIILLLSMVGAIVITIK